MTAALTIVVWAANGTTGRYSKTLQLINNRGATILTFLIVFLIQKSHAKDSKGIHLKLTTKP
ncbi:MAG: low affinity iron permease family protein [Mucilaginibacter sp.]|nr:low affinity iron permease family protein [Mucilaginibacter sp.]